MSEESWVILVLVAIVIRYLQHFDMRPGRPDDEPPPIVDRKGVFPFVLTFERAQPQGA